MTTTTKPAPYVRDVPCPECEGEGSYIHDHGVGDGFRADTRICEDCNGAGVTTESSHGVGDCWVPAGKDAADWQPLDVWLNTEYPATYAVTFEDKRGGFRGSVVGEATAEAGCVNVGDALYGLHIPLENVTSAVCIGTVEL